MNKNIFEKFVRGEATPNEETQVKKWYTSHAHENEMSEYMKEKWDNASDSLSSYQQGRMYHRLMQSIGSSPNNIPQQQSKPTRRNIWWISIAVAASFLLGIFLPRLLTNDEILQVSRKSYIVSAEKGQRASVILPDGTQVWLNSDSKIEYKGDLGIKERLITLTGEAYFEVAKDSKRRFVVSSNGLDVEAIGTSFNIKAYQEEQFVTATLITGQVATRFNNQEHILTPNQSLSVDLLNKTQSKKMIADGSASMWRKNEIAFNGESFEEIALVMNRIYNIQVQFDNESVKSYRYEGVIRNNSLDNFLEVISLTTPIYYRHSGDTIYIGEKKVTSDNIFN